MTMRVLAALSLSTALISPALAFDPTRYGSPTYNTPNVDGLIVQKKLTLPNADQGSTGDASGLSAYATTPAAGVPRHFYEWFSDRANVLAFPGADLSAKFAAACANLPVPPGGGSIYIPRGIYTSAGALVCDGKNLDVRGDGPGVTSITFTSAVAGQAGLSLSPGNITTRVTARDFSLITAVDQINGNKALQIIYPVGGGTIFKGPHVSNIDISGTGNNLQYWASGVSLKNASTFRIDDVSVRGKDVGSASAFPAANMGAAVEILGDTGQQCSDGKITGVTAGFARYGGYVSGDCEGLQWHNFTTVAVDYGLFYPASKGWPGLFLSDSHVNSFSAGVALAGITQAAIHHNLFYKWTGSAQNWVGVSLGTYTGGGSFGSNGNLVTDNQFFGYSPGSAGGTSVSIAAPGGDGNILDRNISVQVDWVFDFAGLGTTNIARDNSALAVIQGWQKNVGLNTISRGNTPINLGTDPAVVVFNPGATTFNVGAYFQKTFATNNPSTAATMADFTNAEIGRQITVIAQDANTSIANNSRIHLKGGTNLTMVSGASLTLLNVGAYWQEIGRSQ